MTQEVHMMVGIPASGKSTFIKQEVDRLEEEGRTVAIISRDVVRKAMLQDGDSYFDKEKEVFNEFIRQINEVLELGIDIVFIDATHINPQSRNKVLSRLNPDPSTDLKFDIMHTPVKLALKRNAGRTGFSHVPDEAIIRMAKNFVLPTKKELVEAKRFGFNNVYMKIM